MHNFIADVEHVKCNILVIRTSINRVSDINQQVCH